MIIYWRVCEKQETQSFAKRWKNKDKKELLRKCWLSIQPSVTKDDTIHILWDKVSRQTINWLTNTTIAKVIAAECPIYTLNDGVAAQLNNVMDARHHHYSFLADYIDNNTKQHMNAYDYPDRYTLDRNRNCELLLNSHSHWRTVPSCTGCTSALGHTWQQHIKLFKQNAIYNSDSFTWEMYAKSGCLAPVPGMATHLTENCLTPRVDWETIYDSIEI